MVNFGPGLLIDGKRVAMVTDKAAAIRLNAEWDRVRRGGVVGTRKVYPVGSVGHSYQRALAIRARAREDSGKAAMTGEQASRDDWPRAWKWLEPVFGDVDPTTIEPEQLQELRGVVSRRVSESEAFRVIKVWRALWKKMAAMGCCAKDADPSLTFPNSAPAPRQGIWPYRDVLRMVQLSWRESYHGLAAAIAVAWDTMLSPVDVRRLTAGQRTADERGSVFSLDRAKTGRAAAGTLSRWSCAVLDAYLERLGITMLDDTPIFWSRGHAPGQDGRPWPPRPYTKDRLSEDFRYIRTLLFGEDDDRQFADMRRSGAVEATAGGARAEKLSSKMANTLSASNRLHKTYVPVDIGTVRDVDDARERGRRKNKNREKLS